MKWFLDKIADWAVERLNEQKRLWCEYCDSDCCVAASTRRKRRKYEH